MARDRIKESHRFYVVGGYFSPTNDAYGKIGLAPGAHRVQMCRLAVEDSPWIMVDTWEVEQDNWQRTSVVLDHFSGRLNAHYKCEQLRIRVMLLAGGDLLESFGTPNLWSPEDVKGL